MRGWSGWLGVAVLLTILVTGWGAVTQASGNRDLKVDARLEHTPTAPGPAGAQGAPIGLRAGGPARPGWDRWLGTGLLGAAAPAAGVALVRRAEGTWWNDWRKAFWSAAGKSFLKTAVMGLAIVAAVAVMVALAPAAAPFVLAVAIVLAAGGAAVFAYRRYGEATQAGAAPGVRTAARAAVAGVGDILGVSGLIEGFTGRRLLTGRRLTATEAGEALGGSAGMALTWAAGGPVARAVHNNVAAAAPALRQALGTLRMAAASRQASRVAGRTAVDADVATTAMGAQPVQVSQSLARGLSGGAESPATAVASKAGPDKGSGRATKGWLEDLSKFANREHPYSGVKRASDYLRSQGVPRIYRKRILESFEVGTHDVEVAGAAKYGLRFHDFGVKAAPDGRYLFETFGPLSNRNNLSLPYEWNLMTGLQQYQVVPGTMMITGRAAPQLKSGSQYVGGATQWFILDKTKIRPPQ